MPETSLAVKDDINDDAYFLQRKWKDYLDICDGAYYKAPTFKQFTFVRAYLETNDLVFAYKAAGYHSIDHLTERMQRLHIQKVRRGRGVQTLIQLAAAEWCDKNKISTFKICDMALDCYNRADTVRDQLRALRFLNGLISHHK